MANRKRVLAKEEQIVSLVTALESVPEKPVPLTKGEILKRLAPTLHRLNDFHYSPREIVDLIDASQDEEIFIKLTAADVRKVLSEKLPTARRRRPRKVADAGPVEQ